MSKISHLVFKDGGIGDLMTLEEESWNFEIKQILQL